MTLKTLFNNIACSIREKLKTSSLIKPINFPDAIKTIPQYVIKVAEFQGLTINVIGNDQIVKSIISSGGLNTIPLADEGEYSVEVKDNNNLVWSKNVVIDHIGTYLVKGRTKSEDDGGTTDERTIQLDAEQLDIACRGGYVQHMFNLRDIWVPIKNDNGSIMKDQLFYIQHFFENDDGSTTIQFATANVDHNVTYCVNYYHAYCASPTATSISREVGNVGGWKYCELRQKFQKRNDEVYMTAQSIVPDGSTLQGIQFSQLRYSKDKYGNTGTPAQIYSYDVKTDSFSVVTSHGKPSRGDPYYVKGYYALAQDGEVTNDNYMNYYTRERKGSNTVIYFIYSLATEYSPETEYYGFYELIQNDGIFYSSLNEIHPYMQDIELKQSSGGGSGGYNGNICVDKVSINSLSELYGLTYSGLMPDGKTEQTKKFYGDPVNYSNNKLDGVKFLDMFDKDRTNGTWTRTLNIRTVDYFCHLTDVGGIYSVGANELSLVRPFFRFK